MILLDNLNTHTKDKIKKIRLEKGLTQKQLAEKCGMYESQIRKYETGKANPKIETLQKIADALEVPIIELRDDLDLFGERVINYFDFQRQIIEEAIKDEELLLDDYRILNTAGKAEARKRIQELTEIKRYTEKEEPPAE